MKIFDLLTTVIVSCCLFLMTSSRGYSQIASGTVSPKSNAILDLTSANKAFLMPRVVDVGVVLSPVDGMMVFDKSCKSVRVYQDGFWSDCFQSFYEGMASFNGSYCASTALSGAAYVVRLRNVNATLSRTFKPELTDVVLTGVSGVTVSTVSPSELTTIGPGAFVDITYTLSGVLPVSGVLNAAFKREKVSLFTSKIVALQPIISNSVVNEIFVKNVTKNFVLVAENAVSIGTASGLPPGLAVSFVDNKITIAGIATITGVYDYSIPVNGCGVTVNAIGRITVVE